MTQYKFVNPLSDRYASPDMGLVFSKENRAKLFRTLWTELARAQKELGLSITKEQIHELEEAIEKTNFERVLELEESIHHDVMAHIIAYGEQCPSAQSIIHLGATSTYVTDNSDLIQIKEALLILRSKMVAILDLLKDFSIANRDLPCLGLTHLQPAQPTTVGKRSALWLAEFIEDFQHINSCLSDMPFLGVKGATGTQASFYTLFNQDAKKVKKLDEKVTKALGFKKPLPLASQTYSRKWDIDLLNNLESFAASAHKFATDIRLLSSRNEIQEGFDTENQVGSSAMPHKRNPIHSERICSLSRLLISLSQNPSYTHATQWLERSLDDSANRRIVIAESFLCADAICNLLISVISKLYVNKVQLHKNLDKELPFLLLENLLMLGVKRGEDRQKLHEKYRLLASKMRENPSQTVSTLLKEEIATLNTDDIEKYISLEGLIGLAPTQVDDFIKEIVHPILKKEKVESFNINIR